MTDPIVSGDPTLLGHSLVYTSISSNHHPTNLLVTNLITDSTSDMYSSSGSSSGSGSVSHKHNSLPVSLLKFMVLDLQTSQDSGSTQSNPPTSAAAPFKHSSQIFTAQSNLPSQNSLAQSKSASSSTAVAAVVSSLPSTSLSNSEEALLCVRVVETLITQARARTRAYPLIHFLLIFYTPILYNPITQSHTT